MPIDQKVEFLPLARLRAEAPAARSAYATAEPFPHVVLDGLFDPALLQDIIREFPKADDVEWIKFKNVQEIKLASNRDEHFGTLTRHLLYYLNSGPFLSFLSEVTEIEGLIADSYFDGGGMHQIERGGKLAVHADFNKHPMTGLDRRLNALLYLNPDWQDDYGGHLELWNRDMTACVRKVAPLFNRMVVFGTTDYTNHGHPDPLCCPSGMTRKSLALYYFTNGRPAGEISGLHSTLFQPRPGEAFEPRQSRVKEIIKDILPPFVTRIIRKPVTRPKGR